MPRAKNKGRSGHARVVAAIVPPVVAAVVQPVAKRLARIEALLIEMRFEYDVQAKRINALKDRLNVLAERLSKRQRARRQATPGPLPNGAGLKPSH